MRYAFYMSIRFGALLSLGVIVIGELRACVRVRSVCVVYGYD